MDRGPSYIWEAGQEHMVIFWDSDIAGMDVGKSHSICG